MLQDGIHAKFVSQYYKIHAHNIQFFLKDFSHKLKKNKVRPGLELQALSCKRNIRELTADKRNPTIQFLLITFFNFIQTKKKTRLGRVSNSRT